MSKGKRANLLIEEYAGIVEKADGFLLDELQKARIQELRAELKALAGDGRPCWDHPLEYDDPGYAGQKIVNGPGWELTTSWATGDNETVWYKELYQARAALALLAHGEVSSRGMSADLSPEGAQFSSRAWVEHVKG